jgi:hypothetical protein
MASRWKPLYKKALDELGLHHKCASVRAIEVPPDNQGLLSGKEDAVFPLLEAAARLAIDQDGADVLILGSTTMHQAHAYLQQPPAGARSSTPGPLSYQIAQSPPWPWACSHSRQAYPRPMHPRLDMLEAMQLRRPAIPAARSAPVLVNTPLTVPAPRAGRAPTSATASSTRYPCPGARRGAGQCRGRTRSLGAGSAARRSTSPRSPSPTCCSTGPTGWCTTRASWTPSKT